MGAGWMPKEVPDLVWGGLKGLFGLSGVSPSADAEEIRLLSGEDGDAGEESLESLTKEPWSCPVLGREGYNPSLD